jgi:pimeloyl-ACP methyl ester carboxylesterase
MRALARATVRASDGVSISYDVRGAGRTALVFVHCWSCSRSYWRNQLDTFAADYRVVSLDLAGHGASGKERASWSVAGLAGDVQAVVEALGLDRVILIGHSMGGPVSLEAARRMPGKVIGVACVDTLHNAEMAMPAAMAEQIAAKLEADFRGATGAFLGSMFAPGADPAVIDWVKAETAKADPKIAVALFRDFPKIDLRKAFSEAKVPIRCVNAAPRPPQSFPTAVAVNRKYADFDAVIVSGVGHYLQLERPAEVNARLGEIFRELDRR